MPSVISLGARIRSNIPAKQAYDSLEIASNKVANSQLRLSTGKQINSAADDVSGFITSRSLESRNSSLRSAIENASQAKNVTAIVQDALDNIFSLVSDIRSSATLASSATTGTDEKVALAKGAYRLTQQISFIKDATVFGGHQLLYGDFDADFIVGYDSRGNVLDLTLDLTSTNSDFNISGNFTLDISNTEETDGRQIDSSAFAGVEGLNLEALDDVNSDDLGIFSDESISSFIELVADSLNNIAKVNAYVGGVQRRLDSQNETLVSQSANYSAAISRLQDADVAQEQLEQTKQSFLRNTSIISLSQANASSINYFRLIN